MRNLPVFVTFALSAALCIDHATALATGSTASSFSSSPDADTGVIDNTITVDSSAIFSSSSSNSGSVDQLTTSTLTPTTTMTIDVATSDSSTFQLVSEVTCSDTIAETIQQTYSVNSVLFNQCVEDSDYQIFPYSGVVPTAQDVTAMVTSEACMAIFIGVTLLELPACSISGMALKSVVETLLMYSVDINDNGQTAPTPEVFQTVVQWRQNVNLATEAGVPNDSDSALYAHFQTNLKLVKAKYTYVTVLSDLTIHVSEGEAATAALSDAMTNTTFASISAGSLMDVAARVTSKTATEEDSSAESTTSADDVTGSPTSAMEINAIDTSSGSTQQAATLSSGTNALTTSSQLVVLLTTVFVISMAVMQ